MFGLTTPHTLPEVFIIESLSDSDERENRYEGQRLTDMLRLARMNPKYFYFQLQEELPPLLALFKASKYRFLHVSCHASPTHVKFADGSVTYARFAEQLEGTLKLRRLFMSACETGNELFTTAIAGTNKGMHSVVAPAEDIRFDYAAALWTSFYISLFGEGNQSLTGQDIAHRLQLLCELFPVKMHLSTYSPKRDGWRHRIVEGGVKP